MSGSGESTFRIADSTIEANTAAIGSGISGGAFRGNELVGGEVQADALVLENSIVVFDNTGVDDEIDGFGLRDVRSTDGLRGRRTHPYEDGAAPALAGDEDVDQTAASPTIDVGDNEPVDTDLTEDYAGDGGAVQGQTQRSCRSKRVFRIRIRVPRGKKARSGTVRVNNKKVKVVRGKRLRAPVRLRGLPKGKFTVKITVGLTNGKKITGKRIYNTCIPKLPGDGPPKV